MRGLRPGRQPARVDGALLLAASLLTGCQAPGRTPSDDGIGVGLATIPLEVVPDQLVASADGRTLLAWTQGEDPHLYILDVPGRRAIRAVPLPVRRVGSDGNPTSGYVSLVALDDAGKTAWAATTEGEVFRIDLATGDLVTVLDAASADDEPRAFTGIVMPYPTLSEIGKRAAIDFFTPSLTRSWLRRIIAWLRIFG